MFFFVRQTTYIKKIRVGVTSVAYETCLLFEESVRRDDVMSIMS